MSSTNNENNELLDLESSAYEVSQTKSRSPRKFNLASKIQKESINIAFKSLMEEVGNLEYKIPKYQRSYVWKKEQVEALVFSLLMDYPIPPIYVYVEPKTKERYILDGQQRIISLYLYYCGHTLKTNDLIDFNKILPSVEKYKNDTESLTDDQFEKKNGKFLLDYINKSTYQKKLKETDFKIKVEHPEVEEFNLNYKELPRDVKIELNKKTLNIVTVKTLEDSSDDSLNRREYCEIFNLLNNGGTPLKPQEIRNAIYSSPFYDMLHVVNDNPKWKKIVGKKYSKHIELLLRCCSMLHFTKLNTKGEFKFVNDQDGKPVYKDYPKLMSLASEEFREFETKEISEFEGKLLKFIGEAYCGSNMIKLSPLMLEGLFLVSQHKKINPADNIKIFQSEEYKLNIKSSSDSRSKIEKRLSIIYDIC